jgi:cyclopropane-fatty-acyl-phospholipid synthase
MIVGAAVRAVESGAVPDAMCRLGIRMLIGRRLAAESRRFRVRGARESFIEQLRTSPIALVPDAANKQHYEVPAEFFEVVLGSRLKYSGCVWSEGVQSLDQAEEAALTLTAERAELRDGMNILELGCGWGSLTLWMAERFPLASVTAVSNSQTQRAFIEAKARSLGLDNLNVITADMNDFDTDKRFDRVVSVEMFEHMRNYAVLLRRIAGWLASGGKLFVHIFCNRSIAYPFEVRGKGDWMAEYFFTGGIMPSADLLHAFQEDLTAEEEWWLDGTHYQRTARAWLDRLDENRQRVLGIFARCYGPRDARRWVVRWRLFFMACEELFGYRRGSEWGVSHYRFSR